MPTTVTFVPGRKKNQLNPIVDGHRFTKALHLIVDGTFNTAPNPMTQMVSVHGLLDSGWHFPLVYGLLPGKT